MDKIMSIILDVFIVVIVFIYAFRGYRSGFVKSIIRFAGHIVALIAGYVGGKLLAGMIATASRGFLINLVSKKVGDVIGVDPQTALMNVYDNVPSTVRYVFESYIGDADAFFAQFSNVPLNVAEVFTDKILIPVVTLFLQGILMIAIFFIVNAIVRLIMRMTGAVRYIPLLGGINSFLGCVLGFLEAAIVICLVTCGVSLFIAVTLGSAPLINVTTIGQSTVFEFLYNINPFCIK